MLPQVAAGKPLLGVVRSKHHLLEADHPAGVGKHRPVPFQPWEPLGPSGPSMPTEPLDPSEPWEPLGALGAGDPLPLGPLPMEPLHYGTKPGHFETSKIHFPTSKGVS